MSKEIATVLILPEGRRVETPTGRTLAEAISPEAWLDLPCGGRGTCGRCLVKAEGILEPPEPDEMELIGPEGLGAGFRLACRAVVSGDVTVTLQPAGPPAGKVLDGMDVSALLECGGEFGRPGGGRREKMTCIPVARLYRSEPRYGGPFGLALDIGTTTLAGYLIDMGDRAGCGLSPRVVAALCATNPQVSRGADVVSRIAYASPTSSLAGSAGEGLREMTSLVLDGLNALASRLARAVGISTDDISCVAAVGNTCMASFFLGVSPEGLGSAPYVPPFRGALAYAARDIGLGVNPEAEVWIAPAIAGYVGGDSVAVGVVAKAIDPDGTWLAVDIGTNGEILLHARGRLFACSTAAGPAFEGDRITCGMRAMAGAIDDVRFEGPDLSPSVSVIGGGAPRGLCGSGLIRSVREMLLNGIIDPSGKFSRGADAGRAAGVELARDPAGMPIRLTQKDVRQLQLGKAAIRTGIDLLMEKAGIGVEHVEAIFLAGAFGNHISPEDAVGLGLLPRVSASRIIALGNAAGTGAQLFLLSEEARDEAIRLASTAEHVELSAICSFRDVFLSNIGFPAP